MKSISISTINHLRDRAGNKYIERHVRFISSRHLVKISHNAETVCSYFDFFLLLHILNAAKLSLK